MGRPKGTIRKPRLIPAEWLSFYTQYVKRALEMRGVPERNQPKNDDLIEMLVARLSDWLDWKRIDEFIESEAHKRGTWAFHEERRVPEPKLEREAEHKRKHKHKHKPDRAAG
jgi:hypothetical protein